MKNTKKIRGFLSKTLSGFTILNIILAQILVGVFVFTGTAFADDSGWKAPTVSVSGGQFTNPDNAFSTNDVYATESVDDDKQQYGTFNISTIPTGSIINGIEVRVEAHSNIASDERHFHVDLSWNNGVNFGNNENASNYGISDSTQTLGSATNTWGRTWSSSEFTNSNFRVRLEADLHSFRTLYLDYIEVKVYFTPPTSIPFTETFGTTNSEIVSGWAEDELAEILGSTSGPDVTQDGTASDKFVKIGKDGYICRAFDATGKTNVFLSYFWNGDTYAWTNDYGKVEYKTAGNCSDSSGWTNISSHPLNQSSDNNWHSQAEIDLPVDNTIFLLRFRNDANQDDEFFRVDDVVIGLAPVCGNGILESGEQCDDHNTVSGDGCSSTCLTESIFYRDADGDGYGDASDSIKATSTPQGYVSNSADCDDTVASCNIDCATLSYADADSDTYGDLTTSHRTCDAPPLYVSDNTDCNDNDATAYQLLQGFADNDGDTYTLGSSQQICSGASLPTGYTATQKSEDCNDNNAAINPGASDSNCNGADEDCSGTADDNYISTTTSCGVGACVATGQKTCVAGAEQDSCIPGTPSAEVCDANQPPIDENCDGSANEGCECTDENTYQCGTDVGECAYGTQTCIGGTLGECNGAINPTTEICDGLDNNCNGTTDEDWTNLSNECVAGQGICQATGNYICDASNTSGPAICSAVAGQPGEEICGNGIDEDCNGSDLACANLIINKIVIGGTKLISDFHLFINALEVFSGANNTLSPGSYTVSETPEPNYSGVISGDCDIQGIINLASGESKSCAITNTYFRCISGNQEACSTGLLGICSAGTQTCGESGSWGTCVQNTQSSTEVCTGGLDEDCDGLIDCADTTDCSQATDCLPIAPTCGDGTCNGDETCSTCSHDCGECSLATTGGGGGGGGGYTSETTTSTVTATPNNGGTTTLSGSNSEVQVVIPPQAVSNDTVFNITAAAPDLYNNPDSSTGLIKIGNHIYKISASVNNTSVTTFSQPLTIIFTYTDLEVAGTDENALGIYWWDSNLGQWVDLGGQVDAANNTVTASVDHLTVFALMFYKAPFVPPILSIPPVPAISPAAGESQVSGASTTTNPPEEGTAEQTKVGLASIIPTFPANNEIAQNQENPTPNNANFFATAIMTVREISGSAFFSIVVVILIVALVGITVGAIRRSRPGKIVRKRTKV